MNKTIRTWLLILMIPFFIGVVIHFIVPLEIILAVGPKIEEAYNSYKIEVQQYTIRSVGFTNSRVIRHRLQLFENIQATLIRLFQIGEIYQSINTEFYPLNNAYELANDKEITGNETTLSRSMWYAGVAEQDDFDDIQKEIFDSYSQIQPYIQSIFNNKAELYQGVTKLEVVVFYNNTKFYFRYPSLQMQEFKTLDNPVLTKNYNASIQNYLKYGHIVTTFDEVDDIVICNIIRIDNKPIGMLSLGISILHLVEITTPSLSIPDFQFSTNEYYLLRPIYLFENISNPQIVAHFKSNELLEIDIPEQTYLDLEPYGLSKEIYRADHNYVFDMFRTQKYKTFYNIPLYLKIYDGSNEVMLYFVVLNNFEKAKLNQENHVSQILTVMIVPSVLLLFFSIIITGLIIRFLLKKLQKILNNLIDYCSLILKGDLNLKINDEGYTEDLKELFEQFQELNKLNKYSDPKYFDVPKPERLIKYLEAYQFFNKYEYNVANLCENIGDCYNSIEEKQNAIEYMRKAINIDLQFFKQKYGGFGGLDFVLEEKLQKKKQSLVQIDKKTKDKEKALARKVRKLVLFLYNNFKPGDTQSAKEVSELTSMLRKLIYPRVLNLQYIGALTIQTRYKLRDNDFSELEKNLERLDTLISGYQERHKVYDEDCNAPPDVIRSYWCFMSAVGKMKDKKMVDAYDFFVKGLYGNYYNPVLHTYTLAQLKRILDGLKIDSSCLKNFKFTYQHKPRGERQYIFLVDVSNPELTIDEIKRWKKINREIAEYIFTRYIKNKDRISINEFCTSTKIVCNLVEKENQEKILKKQLSTAFKCREKTIYSQIIPNLKKTIERVKHLHSQKVFVIFLKDGLQVNGEQVAAQMRSCPNSLCLIITENCWIISNPCQQFFTIQYEDLQDIDRILEQKEIKYADNKIYLF